MLSLCAVRRKLIFVDCMTWSKTRPRLLLVKTVPSPLGTLPVLRNFATTANMTEPLCQTVFSDIALELLPLLRPFPYISGNNVLQ